MSHAGRITTDFMTTENPIQPQTKPEPQAPALRSGDLLDRFVVWLLGYRPGNTRSDKKNGPMTIRTWPEPIWDCAPCGDFYSVTYHIARAPFFLHRWAQTVILGVRYRRRKV